VATHRARRTPRSNSATSEVIFEARGTADSSGLWAAPAATRTSVDTLGAGPRDGSGGAAHRASRGSVPHRGRKSGSTLPPFDLRIRSIRLCISRNTCMMTDRCARSCGKVNFPLKPRAAAACAAAPCRAVKLHPYPHRQVAGRRQLLQLLFAPVCWGTDSLPSLAPWPIQLPSGSAAVAVCSPRHLCA
jgi:hypothetical protein